MEATQSEGSHQITRKNLHLSDNERGRFIESSYSKVRDFVTKGSTYKVLHASVSSSGQKEWAEALKLVGLQ